MNKKRLILIFSVLIVVFLVAYVLIRQISDNTPTENISASIPCPSDPVCIEINAETDFTLLRTDNGWQLAEDEKFPLDSVTCSTLYAALMNLRAQRTIDDGDTSAFGFDAPRCTMTVTDADGTLYRYILGNHNPYNNLSYFSANDAIFMIDSITAQYFLYNTLDFIEEDTAPDIDEADVTYFEVRSATNSWYYTLTASDNAYLASGTLVNAAQPDSMISVDAAAALSLIRNFTMLYFFDCAAYNADNETLVQYGLDEPFATVYLEYTVKDADGNAISMPFAMHFGIRDGKYIYVRMEGSDMVFTANVNETLQFLSPDFASIQTE